MSCTHLKCPKDSLQLVLPKDCVLRYLGETVDGLKSHVFNLIVEHVHQKVQGQVGKLRIV